MTIKELQEAYGDDFGGMLPDHIREQVQVRLDEIGMLVNVLARKVSLALILKEDIATPKK